MEQDLAELYVIMFQRTAEPKASLPSEPDIPAHNFMWTYGALDNITLIKKLDWWIEGGEYKAAVTSILKN